MNGSAKSVIAGLFGLTHPHSAAHLRTLVHSDLVSEIHVCDEDNTVVEETVADNEKVTRGFTDLGEAAASGSRVGLACLPNAANAVLCEFLLGAGIHVLSEKPIGRTAEDVRRVVDAADDADLRLGVMYQNRYHPICQEAKSLLQAGAIGRITTVEARMVTSQVQFRDPSHWLFDKAVSGGGILSWLGCHYFDLLRFFLDSEVETVCALTDTLSGEAIDVEDVASVTMRFENGTIGSLQAGYQLAVSKAGYMGPNYDSYVALRGTEGHLAWRPSNEPLRLDLTSTHSEFASAPSRAFEFKESVNDSYAGVYGIRFLDDFILSAQGRGDPPSRGKDALEVAKIVEGAYASSETGKHVSIARE